MDLVIEFLLELVLEGTIELGTNRKVPKYVRYPLLFVIALFFLGIVSLLVFLGFKIVKDNFLIGSFLIGVAILLVIGVWYRFIREYRKFKDGVK